MQSPVLRSPQLHQGTPTILKANRKIIADSPILKAGNRKIEADTPTQIKAANKKLEVLDTPTQIKAANKKLEAANKKLEVLDSPTQIKAANKKLEAVNKKLEVLDFPTQIKAANKKLEAVNKKLEVLDSPTQIKAANKKLEAANKKLEVDAPAVIKTAQKKLIIEHDTSTTMLKAAARKASVLESPISSVLKSKKRFFKAVKFNEEISSFQDDNNNYNEYQEIKPFKIDKSDMTEKKLGKEDVPTMPSPENCSEPCKFEPSICTTPEDKRAWSEGTESPLAPGILKAREKNDLTGSEVEKLLLERLLIRKDLKLASMQERIKEIQNEMELIKENHANLFKSLRQDAEEKECVIARLQAENNELKSLPGISLLQTILYLCKLPALALSYILYSPLVMYNKVWKFYSCIFHRSADWAEAMCFFIELSAIKLRWKLRECMKSRKPVLSPPPKQVMKGREDGGADKTNKNNNNNLTKRNRKRYHKN